MAAPTFELVTKTIQNPHASMPLTIPILVLCNTPDEDLERNIRANSARDLPWLQAHDAHDGVAVIVGGGPSLAEHVADIDLLKWMGAKIFAVNGASRWLREHGLQPDFQVMADAKAETATLADEGASAHIFASQVHADTMSAVERPTLWHLGDERIEAFFPEQRRKRGGYVLLGGGGGTGNSALCVAYAMGYRQMHCFGLDSSHRAGESHAYRQPMNDFIPTVKVTWAGRTFETSVAMKAQAEKFQITAQALKQAGCKIEVYGDGLLQHIYTAPPESLTERDKYRLMWNHDTYRAVAPGELCVPLFIETARPDGLILDFGCGTGRAALALQERGHEVLAIDFADNCRDDEALGLPFIEWDLTRPCPARGKYGFCTDVMEHIPREDTDTVLTNMFASAPRIFFQIDTEEDVCGQLIGQPLHINIRPHDEWRALLAKHGTIVFEQPGEGSSIFYVIKEAA